MIVKYLPLQPHCFAFGGFDIQMMGTSDAINKCGVDISKLDIWSRDSNFDILHCWGLGFSHYENYFWAKKDGKILVSTILLHDQDTLYEKFRFKVSVKLYKQKLIKEMLQLPDAIVVVNENQAALCRDSYNVPVKKINIIPNVVNDFFFNAANNADNNKTDRYILTVGNVCRRKNQLSLSKACIDLNVKLIIIGKVLNGEEIYGKELLNLVNKNSDLLTWVGELKENSSELINYYKECSVFALPSFIEQQPISLLEAAVLQKPLLAADKTYADQKYYSNIRKVDASSIASIGAGIRDVLENPQNFVADKETLSECKWNKIGESYKNIYLSLLG